MVNDDKPTSHTDRAAVLIRYRENLGFLLKSAAAFDAGDHAEALRMATAVRTLSYDAGQGDSILTQIGTKPRMRWRSFYVPFALEVPEGASVFGSSLHGTVQSADGPTRFGPLDFGADGRQVSYEEWWAGEPVVEFGEGHVSRRQLTLGLANQDGGAHVDLTGSHITALFAGSPKFAREDRIELEAGEQLALQRDLLQIQMRTIATEVLHSIRNAQVAGLI